VSTGDEHDRLILCPTTTTKLWCRMCVQFWSVVGDTCVVMNADCPCCVLTWDNDVPSSDVANTVVTSCIDDDVSCLFVRNEMVSSWLVTDVFVSFRVVYRNVTSSCVVVDVAAVVAFSTDYTCTSTHHVTEEGMKTWHSKSSVVYLHNNIVR